MVLETAWYLKASTPCHAELRDVELGLLGVMRLRSWVK